MSRPVSVERLLTEPLQVINLGLELFAEELTSVGVPVLHVDWRPPAGGDVRLAALLAALEDEEVAPARRPEDR
jgi:hypothetical protein